MTDKISHLRYIDALRGIAFLAVIAVHAGQRANFTAGGIIPAGRYGVQLFFLISTVTLLRSMSMRTSEEQRPLANFYLRRFFRIAPLFWFGIVLYYFLRGTAPTYWAPNGLHPWHFLATFFFVQGWAPTSINSVVEGGWSVSAEMAFYLILPFIWKRINSIAAASLCVIGSLVVSYVLAAVAGRYLSHTLPVSQSYLIPSFIYLWFPAQLCVFFLGFILHYILDSKTAMSHIRQTKNIFALIIASLFGLVAFLRISDPLVLLPFQFLFSLVWIPLVLVAAASQPRLLVNPLTTTIGKLSFSCYILHFAILDLVERWTSHIGSGHPPVQFAALFVSGLIVCLVAAQITFRLIEQPGISFGRAIIHRSEARATRAKTSVVTPA